MIAFTVPGEPIPWKRARSVGRRRFTDPKDKAHRAEIALRARAAGARPITGEVCVELRFVRSTQRRVDIDNLAKSVLDALVGVAFVDDTQVSRLVVTKLVGDSPRTECIVSPLDGL